MLFWLGTFVWAVMTSLTGYIECVVTCKHAVNHSLASDIASSAITDLSNCQYDEAIVHPCPILDLLSVCKHALHT